MVELADMVLAAASDALLEQLVGALDARGVPEIRPLVEPLIPELPESCRRTWETDGRGLEDALRAILDGSNEHQRRRSRLRDKLVREERERQAGLAKSWEPAKPRLAIQIRCAGNGRRCKVVRGNVFTLPGRAPGTPVLLVENDMIAYGGGKLQFLVPDDFGGGVDILYSARCDHNSLVTHREGERIISRGTSVRMPAHLLQPPYFAYLQTATPQTLRWAPGAAPTVHT
ncbi:hypothetical protein ACFY00_24920 [Kitasatospora sp. NPDC001540]|uniref:hypothetical protein n=1 Tax=Kitasatospora sp. NPDC001540 TaxID=3364014 RepID=UPI0036A5D647